MNHIKSFILFESTTIIDYDGFYNSEIFKRKDLSREEKENLYQSGRVDFTNDEIKKLEKEFRFRFSNPEDVSKIDNKNLDRLSFWFYGSEIKIFKRVSGYYVRIISKYFENFESFFKCDSFEEVVNLINSI
jgi:hypothetical protein